MNFRQQLIDKFGSKIIKEPGCIILSNDEKDFWELLINFSAKKIVEIGTARGISAAMLTELAEEIWTFDIKDYLIKHEIWKYFEVENKITDFIVKDTLELASIINDIKFDAAHIDGNHVYEYVIRDIFLVERCNKIIFHDYHLQGVVSAINNLISRRGGQVVVKGKFALWSVDEKVS